MKILLLLIFLTPPKGWIWYKEKKDTTKIDTTKIDTTKTEKPVKTKTPQKEKAKEEETEKNPLVPEIGDTIWLFKSPLQTQPLILQDSLPLSPETPEPIRRLILNPTKENAIRYLAWLYAIMERSYLASQIVSETAREIGLDFSGRATLLNKENPAEGKPIYTRGDFRKAVQDKIVDSLKNEIYLVYFFSINCPYCEKELPNLKALWNEGFFITGVNIDNLSEEELEFYKQNKEIPFPVKPDEGEAEEVGVISTPTIIAVNPNKNKIYILAREFTSYVNLKRLLSKIPYWEGESKSLTGSNP